MPIHPAPITTNASVGGIGERARFQSGRDQNHAVGHGGGNGGFEARRGRFHHRCRAGWLTPQYLLAVREQLAALPEGPERFKLLRLAAGDVVALQRGGHSAARLQLDREKLER